MPLSLGNLGSRVRCQAGSALANRSVAFCNAMAMSTDLVTFGEDYDDMDVDESEDEVVEKEDSMLPVGVHFTSKARGADEQFVAGLVRRPGQVRSRILPDS